VFWLLGDESTADETFSASEQTKVRQYLEGGGRLFVSGSEVAWDLDTAARGSASDEQFLHDYLKAAYVNDDAGSAAIVGEAGNIFAGLDFTYGSLPYIEDYPDAIAPQGGSAVCLRYANGLNAAVQFEGIFPNGSQAGKLVYLGFPFETISAATARVEVLRRVLEFFFPSTTAVAGHERGTGLPAAFVLSQNYPNPFNPGTMFRFGLPGRAQVRVEIFDVLGQRVRAWPARLFEAGFHEEHWNGLNGQGAPVASGEYFLRATAVLAEGKESIQTVKMRLLR